MPAAPSHSEIFRRAVEEGERRLDQSSLELTSTGFIAGFTIVLGIVAQAIVHAAVEPAFGEVARVAGALGFGFGMVFLIAGRAELFNENFFDPAAALADDAASGTVPSILRLWAFTFAFNLVGGALFVLVLSVEGALPPGTGRSLRTTAEEIARRGALPRLASSIAGGVLVSLLSHLLVAVESAGSRISVTYMVGVMLALGPFDHVVVTLLHVLFGVLYGAPVGGSTVATIAVVVTAGNLVGGVGLVATTHVAQAVGADESSG